MTRKQRQWTAIATIAVVGLGLTLTAEAHDPYTGIKNKHGVDCCGGYDCAPAAATDIGEDGPYYTYKGLRFFKSESQPSFDQQYHVCIGQLPSVPPGRYIRCFLRPTPGS